MPAMPRDAERPPRRVAPKMPQTLSLPAIPPPQAPGRAAPSSAPVSRPRPSVPAREPRPRRAPELLPSPDAWDDEYVSPAPDDRDDVYHADPADEAAVAFPAKRRSVPTSRNLMRTSDRTSVLMPVSPLRLGAAPRPLRRTLLWQMMLALVALLALALSIHEATPPASAYASAFQAQSALQTNERIVDKVPIQTQIDPTIGYDSPAQYKAYSDAACGAASTSSVLLAWGDPKGRIGQVIDDMIPYIQPIGMVDPVNGFRQVAQRHGFDVVITNSITPAQIAEIVSVQGIPVVVGIRDTSGGYYSYFSPGHFLVIVGADPNGFRVVDNSTYFVHYFPTATFLQLWDYPRATIYYPPSYNFQMP
jgi:hypothetical protein